eukprot:3614135-Rhodomonas_salina.2
MEGDSNWPYFAPEDANTAPQGPGTIIASGPSPRLRLSLWAAEPLCLNTLCQNEPNCQNSMLT